MPRLAALVSVTESKYIEKTSYLSQLAHEQELAFRETEGHLATEFGSEEEWRRCVQEDFPKFLPYLRHRCGLRFHGRMLEIGAGAAWFSAELSKLPDVVEVIATDFSPMLLKELAPKVFALLQADTAKITRTPADFHKLEFPDTHFDFVVCSAVLHHAVDMTQVLREARRVLKPRGQLVAIREPVWPLIKFKSRSRTQTKLVAAGVNEHLYTLAEYRSRFAEAGLALAVKRVNLATGLKFLFNELVNGLTHARYAFVATKLQSV
ncbi:MAG: class I SAM-dependent methyltransferase [Verrucomicrobia bacterium]|nr:class I SAM-dependent methyltransferase [Verrucomicrobiota bacterium]